MNKQFSEFNKLKAIKDFKPEENGTQVFEAEPNDIKVTEEKVTQADRTDKKHNKSEVIKFFKYTYLGQRNFNDANHNFSFALYQKEFFHDGKHLQKDTTINGIYYAVNNQFPNLSLELGSDLTILKDKDQFMTYWENIDYLAQKSSEKSDFKTSFNAHREFLKADINSFKRIIENSVEFKNFKQLIQSMPVSTNDQTIICPDEHKLAFEKMKELCSDFEKIDTFNEFDAWINEINNFVINNIEKFPIRRHNFFNSLDPSESKITKYYRYFDRLAYKVKDIKFNNQTLVDWFKNCRLADNDDQKLNSTQFTSFTEFKETENYQFRKANKFMPNGTGKQNDVYFKYTYMGQRVCKVDNQDFSFSLYSKEFYSDKEFKQKSNKFSNVYYAVNNQSPNKAIELGNDLNIVNSKQKLIEISKLLTSTKKKISDFNLQKNYSVKSNTLTKSAKTIYSTLNSRHDIKVNSLVAHLNCVQSDLQKFKDTFQNLKEYKHFATSITRWRENTQSETKMLTLFDRLSEIKTIKEFVDWLDEINNFEREEIMPFPARQQKFSNYIDPTVSTTTKHFKNFGQLITKIKETKVNNQTLTEWLDTFVKLAATENSQQNIGTDLNKYKTFCF